MERPNYSNDLTCRTIALALLENKLTFLWGTGMSKFLTESQEKGSVDNQATSDAPNFVDLIHYIDQNLENTLKQDFEIDEYYPEQPLPSIDVPVLLGRCTKDDSVPKSSFEKWSSIIMADSLIKEYEGDHFFIYDSDNSFINDLNDFLEKVGY